MYLSVSIASIIPDHNKNLFSVFFISVFVLCWSPYFVFDLLQVRTKQDKDFKQVIIQFGGLFSGWKTEIFGTLQNNLRIKFLNFLATFGENNTPYFQVLGLAVAFSSWRAFNGSSPSFQSTFLFHNYSQKIWSSPCLFFISFELTRTGASHDTWHIPFPVSIHTTNSQSIFMALIKYRHIQYLIFNVICKTCTVKRNKLTSIYR